MKIEYLNLVVFLLPLSTNIITLYIIIQPLFLTDTTATGCKQPATTPPKQLLLRSNDVVKQQAILLANHSY